MLNISQSVCSLDRLLLSTPVYINIQRFSAFHYNQTQEKCAMIIPNVFPPLELLITFCTSSLLCFAIFFLFFFFFFFFFFFMFPCHGERLESVMKTALVYCNDHSCIIRILGKIARGSSRFREKALYISIIIYCGLYRFIINSWSVFARNRVLGRTV